MRFLYPGGGLTKCYGVLTAPNHKGVPLGIISGKPWAGDLGAKAGPEWIKQINLAAVVEWLTTMTGFIDQCLFLAGNDYVGNAQATLEAYSEFEQMLPGWPLAYVAQNGAEDLAIPSSCTAVFIGGDTKWKTSQAAVSVIKRAQQLAKHIHIGRVNWKTRYQMFRVLQGSNDFTCDGTRPRFDGKNKTEKAWRGYEQQEPLFYI